MPNMTFHEGFNVFETVVIKHKLNTAREQKY